MSNFSILRNYVSRRGAIALLAACAATIVGFSGPAKGGDMTEPVSLITPTTFEAGATINCQVSVTDVPTSVHIYSNPPGVVSYDGTIGGTTATIPVQTNPNASGDVTVYLSTGGSQVVSDTSTVEGVDQPDPGP